MAIPAHLPFSPSFHIPVHLSSLWTKPVYFSFPPIESTKTDMRHVMCGSLAQMTWISGGTTPKREPPVFYTCSNSSITHFEDDGVRFPSPKRKSLHKGVQPFFVHLKNGKAPKSSPIRVRACPWESAANVIHLHFSHCSRADWDKGVKKERDIWTWIWNMVSFLEKKKIFES